PRIPTGSSSSSAGPTAPRSTRTSRSRPRSNSSAGSGSSRPTSRRSTSPRRPEPAPPAVADPPANGNDAAVPTPRPGSPEWHALVVEEIVDPDRRIVDPHHHLWPAGG